MNLFTQHVGKINKSAILIVSAGFFMYVALRAYFLSFTIDEISSFEHLETFSLATISLSANYHLLNLFLMKFCSQLFGGSEFALRLPNVLAFLLYLIFAVKINRNLQLPFKFSALILLTCNPFLLDFFSLARGYGLSLGFMLPSLYFLLQYVNGKKFYAAVISLLFAWLALLSNFTLLNYTIPLVGILLLTLWMSSNLLKQKLWYSIILLIISACAIAPVVQILFRLKDHGELYFGGNVSIAANTIGSLARCFAYFSVYRIIAKYLFIGVFWTALIFSALSVMLFIKRRQLTTTTALSFLLVCGIAMPIIQHLVFHTLYPVERAAIMYCPLVVLALFQPGGAWKFKSVKWIHCSLLLLLCVHFFLTMNFTHSYSWRYDSGTKKAFTYLKNTVVENKVIGVDDIHIISATYYLHTLNASQLRIQSLGGYWKFKLGCEELNPNYYGMAETNKISTPINMNEMLYDYIDYYYFDQYFLDRMKKEGIAYRVIEAYPFSRSALIELPHRGNN